VSRTREFWHQDLSGEPVAEETEVIRDDIESVRCRWCAGGGVVELVARPAAADARTT
jgi:hypothetical protein